MDPVRVAELEKESVAAGRDVLGRERQGIGAQRVDVLVGEVAGAQHDEVPAGAEVGLQVADGGAVPGDGEAQFAVGGGARVRAAAGGVLAQREVVAIDAGG